ncbi:MAG: DUF3574 domain-containing protein [Acidobacteria bacterium]|nr:DUF3574 domain-containing protein [Acidobacteriota bacterium]
MNKYLIILPIMMIGFLLAAETGAATVNSNRPVPAFSDSGIRKTPVPIYAADKFYRTELYFGTDIAGGGKVADADWNRFLEETVTPRFPDGFTVLDGFGQYRDATGRIVREPSRVIVFLYPKAARREAGRKIDEIRAEYKKRFRQESVLRLDFTKAVTVDF